MVSRKKNKYLQLCSGFFIETDESMMHERLTSRLKEAESWASVTPRPSVRSVLLGEARLGQTSSTIVKS